jgi:hypothetical protein
MALVEEGHLAGYFSGGGCGHLVSGALEVDMR